MIRDRMLASFTLLTSAILSILLTASTSNLVTADEATNTSPKISIYHMEGRRSERIVWLLEELGLPYELQYKRGDLRGSAMLLRSVNSDMPMFPTVFIDDQRMVESGAIIEVLLDRYAPNSLRPAVTSPDYPDYKMWMHYAEGTIAARLFSDYREWRREPPTSRSPLVDSEATVQFAENYLEEHKWFGGDAFSAADIMMMFPLRVATGLNLVDERQFPQVAAWKERIRERPAYQRMLKQARPDGMQGSLPPVEQRPPSERRVGVF